MIAPQPRPFHVLQPHIFSQMCSEEFSHATGSLMAPMASMNLEKMPVSIANMAIAKENTSAQEMKLGRVVNICTHFLKRMLLTSFRKMAKIMGRKLVARFRPLIPKVFFSTRMMLSRWP